MPQHMVKKDVAQMSDVVDWLGTWHERRRVPTSWGSQRQHAIHFEDALPAVG